MGIKCVKCGENIQFFEYLDVEYAWCPYCDADFFIDDYDSGKTPKYDNTIKYDKGIRHENGEVIVSDSMWSWIRKLP